ncbi:uncharacterized protein LDX57_003106 [Aspergillus melleus]|uniref:uncharacterized protein n=1 Tax=Aspergillus melleus TaxID=138277 RepID=UPI001E8EB37F|nr:uncharacterized protein LDX57_003106 [Aspergillus melleus]KAH8425350.1 hypothetical protein LDX57_003106 [Aspergillus melleus]
MTEAAPGTLRRKMPKKKAQDRSFALETYDDDSDGMEDEPITPEPKPAFKKRRTSSDSEMDVDIPISSIEGTSSRTTIRFDVPHEHDTFHGGWDNSRLKRRSIAHEDDETAFVPQSDEEDDSDDSVHITANEKSEVVFDFSTEKARRWTDAINLPENIYNEAEQDLFFRLSMRGFEPALPSHWKFDFPTLPISLFPEPGLGFEPILQISGASEFYGKSVTESYLVWSL